jgi:hypothetical protein
VCLDRLNEGHRNLIQFERFIFRAEAPPSRDHAGILRKRVLDDGVEAIGRVNSSNEWSVMRKSNRTIRAVPPKLFPSCRTKK